MATEIRAIRCTIDAAGTISWQSTRQGEGEIVKFARPWLTALSIISFHLEDSERVTYDRTIKDSIQRPREQQRIDYSLLIDVHRGPLFTRRVNRMNDQIFARLSAELTKRQLVEGN